VPSSCPICEQPIASTAVHCAVCGFPTGLAIEGLRSVDAAEPDGASADGPRAAEASAASRTKPPPSPPSAEEELNAAISRDLRSRMDAIRELGRGPDVTNELCEAALSEAEGRVAEALGILRSAQSRLERETEEVLHQRVALLKERREALEKTGVRFSIGPDVQRLTAATESGDRDEAVGLLVGVERRVAQFESDWKGLQGLLAQIEGLRNEAAELTIPLGEISSELEGLRDHLGENELTEESLDTFAQEAAQILMLLHEAIPSSLEEELARTEATLDRFPEDHPGSAVARRLQLEAGRHLKKGRLSEAMQSLRELRRALAQLEKPPVAPPAAPAITPEEEDVMLDRLLKKARSLAARVRTLPPDSETARDAAIQIREATDLLRARNLKEADLTLTRLMRMLASEPPRT
jgi:chromosome segregation ATPase